MKAQAKKPRYLPEYTESGDLILPKNFRACLTSDLPAYRPDRRRLAKS
jgi:hypothetical protein